MTEEAPETPAPAEHSAAGAAGGPSPSTTAARVLLQALARLGVREVVLAPGSRSAPLAHALAEAASDERDPAAPRLELHVRVDERDAGFLALGLATAARAAGHARPVAVVTTSGTAVANLHPAVLEADHAGLPLLLLTADRPHELRGTGANQTTEQVGLLEPAVRLTLDVPAPTGRAGEERDLRHLAARAVAAATGARTGDPGPVHVNLAFRDPLVPDASPWPAWSGAGLTEVLRRGAAGHAPPAGSPLTGGTAQAPAVGETPPTSGGTSPTSLAGGTSLTSPARGTSHAPLVSAGRRVAGHPDGVRTVVVAGDGAGAVARRIAEANGWPLLAEPSSGARGGPNAVPAYRLLLGEPALGGAVQRVVVLGRPTLSRPVQQLLGRADVESLVVAPVGARWPDAVRAADQVVAEVPPLLLEGGLAGEDRWLTLWQRAGAAAADAVAEVLDRPGPLTGPAVAAAVAAASEVAAAVGGTGPAEAPGPVLVVGSSNPVRDLDLVAAWSEPPLVLANRGLAGIDGTLSTASGVALGLDRPVRAYVGDLTFLHDVGGLLVGPLERRPDLQVVVANDDGGSIFASLEHGAPEHARAFERVFATPHGADLRALCAGYGVRHTRVGDADDLRRALAAGPGPGGGVEVVEVVVDRADRRALGDRIAAAVHDALRPVIAAAGS
ncbi:2-succinyl-5-enolpyruvyl-6-hydroxy-3-cyclohexene-1-carboxylic-acid synthase [Actinotalea solisilvae]|uniref:2-succinyl-5-enolpyruvyl-6-hydroxy-3- cyclohexene-1-carboxylic-acid synthase n=1 Tax=Actinotalea solisilvae TaxID=2072922 RepID=UPI0018F1EB27|nr:2-succinyl-5-enolpyruvyl-6-hydroxy-3-cyclohexene-1-carboxylic-acid synthase [Actinotalea solisilvae]